MFEARTVWDCAIVASSAKSEDFGSSFSTIASMTRSAHVESAIVPGVSLSWKPATSGPGQALPTRRDPRETPLETRGIGVRQRCLNARLCDDLGNTAAHRPGTHDQHAFDNRGLDICRRLTRIQGRRS